MVPLVHFSVLYAHSMHVTRHQIVAVVQTLETLRSKCSVGSCHFSVVLQECFHVAVDVIVVMCGVVFDVLKVDAFNEDFKEYSIFCKFEI